MQNVHAAPASGTPLALSGACTGATFAVTAESPTPRPVSCEVALTYQQGAYTTVAVYAPELFFADTTREGRETTLTLQCAPELLPALAAALTEAVRRSQHLEAMTAAPLARWALPMPEGHA
jgi:hypothetical protein